MGGETFQAKAKGKTAAAAFQAARKQAQYDHGHSGYTGTIAEKHDFVMISLPDGKAAHDYAEDLIQYDDKRISDKWGPAGCIKLDKDEWLFFGWASR